MAFNPRICGQAFVVARHAFAFGSLPPRALPRIAHDGPRQPRQTVLPNAGGVGSAIDACRLHQQKIVMSKSDIGYVVGIHSSVTSISIGDASEFMRTLRCSVRNP